MTNIDAIRKKVRALREMTTKAGCTEAEALAAAEKAAELMREYGLNDCDLSIGQAAARSRSKGQSARDGLWSIVAFCTNTAATLVHRPGKSGGDLIFVGREPGPEIAAYLVAILNRAIDTAIAEFKLGQFYRRRRTSWTRRQAVSDFTAGMVARLSRRLIDIFEPSIDKTANALAAAAREQMFEGATSVNRREASIRYSEAASVGWVSGGRVPLSHGVGAGNRRLQIGPN